LDGPTWLARRRQEAWERFSALALPSEAEEIWRYSGIDTFDLDAFAPVAPAGNPQAALRYARSAVDPLGVRSGLVVTRHGVVIAVEVDPAVVDDGSMTLVSSRGAPAGGTVDAPEHLGELVGALDAFSVLHDAFLADVVEVTVAPKKVVPNPVVIVHLVETDPIGTAASAPSVFPRTLVRVGVSASGEVIEVLVSMPADGGGGDAPSEPGSRPSALVVPVAELDVADDARLSYANVQLLHPGTVHIGTQASRVGRDATLRSFTVGLGGSYARVRTDSAIVGPGGNTSLLAAYLGTGSQVHDFRTLQDHHAPRTSSELLFKGAVADRSRSVYSGLIRMRNGARGANAFQTNHNLVLSEGAHADSVPNLDIEENDVRCSHASTVGPVDESQRYYLESRGIEPAVAERLIVLGFFSDLAARSPFGGVGRMLEDTVARRLAGRLPSDGASAVASDEAGTHG
jgi:Fe-S cluster assembly protein SufD